MNNNTVEMEQNNVPDNMEQPTAPQYNPPKILTRKTKRLIFYSLIVALPFLQFLIFYVYVNIDSILMAFRVTKLEQGGYVEYWDFTANFIGVYDFLVARQWKPITVAARAYLISFFTSGIFSIFFSYYVYKKFMFSGLFKVFLYLPSMVSSVVLTLVFRTICNSVIPAMYYDATGQVLGPLLMTDPNQTFAMLVGYSIFFSLGGHILMYTGTMGGINESVVESAQLDGVNPIQEFIFITLPLIWPTFVTFTVTGLAGIFTNQLGLHTFFGDGAPTELATLGYELFVWTKKGSVIGNSADTGLLLSEISATGLVIMAVILPTAMGLKKLLTKLGPSVD